MNRLSVWGKGEKIARTGKEKGESLQTNIILGPSFHGTSCASDPEASSFWREH